MDETKLINPKISEEKGEEQSEASNKRKRAEGTESDKLQQVQCCQIKKKSCEEAVEQKNGEYRDWANLDHDILHNILHMLLLSPERSRFFLVCKQWFSFHRSSKRKIASSHPPFLLIPSFPGCDKDLKTRWALSQLIYSGKQSTVECYSKIIADWVEKHGEVTRGYTFRTLSPAGSGTNAATFSTRRLQPTVFRSLPIDLFLLRCVPLNQTNCPNEVVGLSKFEIYRLSAGTWIKCDRLHDCAVFVDTKGQALSCMNPSQWGGKDNMLYLTGPSFEGWEVFPLDQPVNLNRFPKPSEWWGTGTWPRPLWVLPAPCYC